MERSRATEKASREYNQFTQGQTPFNTFETLFFSSCCSRYRLFFFERKIDTANKIFIIVHAQFDHLVPHSHINVFSNFTGISKLVPISLKPPDNHPRELISDLASAKSSVFLLADRPGLCHAAL